MMTNNRNNWLSTLFYDIGKQKTSELQVQKSFIKDEEVIFCRRHKAIDVIGTDVEFSHRTILMNEIVLDIDPRTDKHAELCERYCKYLHNQLSARNFRHYIIFSGSKGFHTHIFSDNMFMMGKYEREKYRQKIANLFIPEYDEQLLKENHMIAMEVGEHWKTGNNAILLYAYGLESYGVVVKEKGETNGTK